LFSVFWFVWGGRGRQPEGWTPGAYTGTFTLSRAGETVISETVEVVIER
jgi:hypothetical protein